MNAMSQRAAFGGAEAREYTNPHDPQVIQLEIEEIVNRTGDLLIGTFFERDAQNGQVILPNLASISRNIVYYRRLIGVYLKIILEHPGKISREELAQLKYKDNMGLAELLYAKGLLPDSDW